MGFLRPTRLLHPAGQTMLTLFYTSEGCFSNFSLPLNLDFIGPCKMLILIDQQVADISRHYQLPTKVSFRNKHSREEKRMMKKRQKSYTNKPVLKTRAISVWKFFLKKKKRPVWLRFILCFICAGLHFHTTGSYKPVLFLTTKAFVPQSSEKQGILESAVKTVTATQEVALQAQ